MRLEDAKRFVEQNARLTLIGSELNALNAEDVGCIDDRYEIHRVAWPGGVLGLVGVLVAGLQLFERVYGSIGIEIRHLTRVVEKRFGAMTCHTDTNAINGGNNSIVGGCGYWNGLLGEPNKYGVGDRVHLVGDYIVELKNRGVSPKILEGENAPEALLVVAKADNGQPTIVLPGTAMVDGKKRKVLVCHKEDWLELLVSLVFDAAKYSNGIAGIAHKANLCEYVKVAALRQLDATMMRFPYRLPVFYVFCNNSNNVCVEPFVKNAAEAFFNDSATVFA